MHCALLASGCWLPGDWALSGFRLQRVDLNRLAFGHAAIAVRESILSRRAQAQACQATSPRFLRLSCSRCPLYKAIIIYPSAAPLPPPPTPPPPLDGRKALGPSGGRGAYCIRLGVEPHILCCSPSHSSGRACPWSPYRGGRLRTIVFFPLPFLHFTLLPQNLNPKP